MNTAEKKYEEIVIDIKEKDIKNYMKYKKMVDETNKKVSQKMTNKNAVIGALTVFLIHQSKYNTGYSRLEVFVIMFIGIFAIAGLLEAIDHYQIDTWKKRINYLKRKSDL